MRRTLWPPSPERPQHSVGTAMSRPAARPHTGLPQRRPNQEAPAALSLPGGLSLSTAGPPARSTDSPPARLPPAAGQGSRRASRCTVASRSATVQSAGSRACSCTKSSRHSELLGHGTGPNTQVSATRACSRRAASLWPSSSRRAASRAMSAQVWKRGSAKAGLRAGGPRRRDAIAGPGGGIWGRRACSVMLKGRDKRALPAPPQA